MRLTAKTKQNKTMRDVDVAIQKPITKFCVCNVISARERQPTTSDRLRLCLNLLTRKLPDGFWYPASDSTGSG